MAISAAKIANQTVESSEDTLGIISQTMQLCRVEQVNSDLTVDVSVLSGNRTTATLNGVKVSSAYMRGTSGMVSMPEVGSIGVVAIISSVHQVILGFLNYGAPIDKEIYSMSEGEHFIRNEQGAAVRWNDNGGIDMSSSGTSSFHIAPDIIVEGSESKASATVASESFSGIDGDIVHSIEKCYDKDIEVDMTHDEIMSSMDYSDMPSLYEKERTAVLEIQKGNVIEDVYDNESMIVKKVKLDLYTFDEDNPEAAYRIKVMSEEGNNCSILIGKDGSVQVDANVLKINTDMIDMYKSRDIEYDKLNFMRKDWR